MTYIHILNVTFQPIFYLIPFYFWKVVQMTKDICAISQDVAIAESIVLKWFARFRNGNFALKDQEHSGKLAVDDQIEILDENPHHTRH